MNNVSTSEQNVTLTGRARIELSGVSDVESFTDTSVIAETTLGNISIDGEDLKIESFSADIGRLVVNGKFDGFCYFGKESKKRGFFFSKEGKK